MERIEHRTASVAIVIAFAELQSRRGKWKTGHSTARKEAHVKNTLKKFTLSLGKMCLFYLPVII